jgi:hypothetical protein
MPHSGLHDDFDDDDDSDEGPPELSLEDQINTAILLFEQDWTEISQAEENADLAPVIQLVDRASKLILDASDDMIAPNQMKNLPQLRSLLMELGLLEYVLATIQVAVAREYSTGVDEKADRCFQLAELVIQNPPSEHVLRYLKRMSRCYVNGFMPETVVMCRAVFENALTQTFERHGVPRPERMLARIAAAQTCGWLSENAATHARAIWTRGNKAVHVDPTAITDALDTVKLTMEVLRELVD